MSEGPEQYSDFAELGDGGVVEESLHNQLNHFISSGQWERAREVAGTLLSQQPDSAWLHDQMGDILYKLESYPESEKHYKRAVGLMPDYAPAFFGLARVYMALGRNGVAEDNIRRCLSLDPSDAYAWLLLGHLHLTFEAPEKAEECAETALRLDPECIAAVNLRASARGEKKGAHKASADEQIREHTSVLEADPENDIAHMYIGMVYHDELKDYLKAEGHFRKALGIDPHDKDYQRLLISTLRKLDPLLKILWSPVDLVLKILSFFDWCWDKKWPLVFCLLLAPVMKFLFVFAIGLAVVFFVFIWPVIKTYEWFTLVEVHKKMGKLAIYDGPFAWLHRMSFIKRCSLFAVLFVLFWGGLVTALINAKSREPVLSAVVVLVAIAVFLAYVVGWGSLIFKAYRRRIRAKKEKNFQSQLSEYES